MTPSPYTYPEGDPSPSEPTASLFGGAMGSLKWSFGSSATTLVLQLAYTATVSRLVAPKAFGLFALGGLLLRLISYFAQLGLGSALVQRATLDDSDVRVAFTASALLGVVVFAIAWVMAPVVAPFVTPDRSLIAVSRALSGTFIFTGLSVTAQALLQREFQFQRLALIDIAAFILGYVVLGLPLALMGAGVWSLAAAAIGSSAATAIAQLCSARHSMRPLWDGGRFRGLASFGGVVSIIGFLEFVGSTLDTLSVGHFAGPTAVGNYSRATALVTPVERFASATSTVLYPNFARVGADRQRTSRAYLSGLTLIATAIMVPASCLAAASSDIVTVLLGNNWGLAASLLPFIALAVGIGLVTRFSGVVCEAMGLLRGKVIIQAIHILTVIAVIVLTVSIFDSDPRGFAIAWLVGEFVRQAIYTVWLGRTLRVSLRCTASRLAEVILLAGVPAGSVVLIRSLLPVPVLFRLLLAGAGAAVSLGGVLAACPGLAILQEVRDRDIVSTLLGRR